MTPTAAVDVVRPENAFFNRGILFLIQRGLCLCVTWLRFFMPYFRKIPSVSEDLVVSA